jgi:methyltransferase-like protein 23
MAHHDVGNAPPLTAEWLAVSARWVLTVLPEGRLSIRPIMADLTPRRRTMCAPSNPLPRSSLSLTTVVVAGRRWRVWCVERQDDLLTLSERFAHPPYGLLLWESAVALAQRLAEAPEIVANKRVLELGAGVGLPGLVARTLGAQVWQTDQLEEALDTAELNARENGVAGIQRFLGDWTRWSNTSQYDVILGADILYETTVQPAVASILDSNLVPGGRMLLADPGRPQALEFLAKLEDEGQRFEVSVRTVSPTCPLGSREEVDILLVEQS